MPMSTWLRPTILSLIPVFLLARPSPAHGSRPQLVIDHADADLAAGTLVVEGLVLVWDNDLEVTVTLGGDPLTVVEASASRVVALLPPMLASGCYRLHVLARTRRGPERRSHADRRRGRAAWTGGARGTGRAAG
jgi:hypothetical protein